MKRTAVFALCLALALSLLGCGTKPAEGGTPIAAAGGTPIASAGETDDNGEYDNSGEPDDFGELSGSDENSGAIREDVCGLYLEVL